MESAIAIIFQLAILIFSVVIHEVSHGLAANALGDPTAKYAGRLTLNPAKHLDPVGSVLVPLATFIIPRLLGGAGFIIGWAKPVPYNPSLLRNAAYGPALVGAAGPLSNIAVAVFFGLLIRVAGRWDAIAPGAAPALLPVFSAIVVINLVLAIFNLVPIPPLDGSKVLFALLPAGWEGVEVFLERFGIPLLIVFIFYFAGIIFPIVALLFRLITGGALF